MSMGGSGFTVITYHNQRLAYMQVDKDTPPQPVHPADAIPSVGEGRLDLRFYQLQNEHLWQHISAGADLYGGLRLHHRYGNIEVRKLIKSPSGVIRTRIYEVTGWHIADDETFEAMGKLIPRNISLTYSHTTIYPPPQEHIT